ncbi:hypothetical protein AB1A81_06030 [Bdellovibrio bacteriovorus]|uniref:Uncharacterized protein n=1 Tax=Bdellovibrio bacteriovorus (strain ATCC 15356 / DSM 50701 / NCIMB 9529 / HD100) TaxID=264462 RepID=Q6MND1_BDEBA|nr:hypothetical protein [Bdellovibrio bacteriovorus]AHZ86532.1 hypothetical protein EP01_16545 [Bdellovibrio bacteriovorus]BEV67776.1 hypothetical protein Bb109J_c1196 [Bdellovibrio bacteriovorus]CAE79221.1 hypothetical protein predicted by Glimmer/Critica [Bdellovibrio bacteriovorus HD100]
MPEIKHYDAKKKHHHPKKRRPHHEAQAEIDEATEIRGDAEEIIDEAHATGGEAKATMKEAKATMEAADEINTEAQNEGVKAEQTLRDAHEMESEGAPAFSEDTTDSDIHHSEEKVHLEFYGSEMIRQKAPKVMEIADTVADEWKKDGQFEGLPVGNPIAQMAAAKALRTAKDVDKKLEEKGVYAMAKMGIDLIKSKIEKRNH